MWILRLLKPLSKRQRVENVRIKIATCRYHWGIMLNTYARSRYLKAAKFAVLTPGRTGFPNRAKRSEGSNSAPVRNAPCFGVCALVCDLSPKAECVPAFAHESKRRPFVLEVEKRLEMELATATFWRYSWEWVWAKNRTLQEGFSRGEGRSILAQDKGLASQAPPQPPLLPAVRAVDGGFSAVGCGAF